MNKTDARRSADTLFTVTCFFWFSQYAYFSYVVPELESMGAAATLIGVVTGMYGFTQLLLRLPLGIVAGRLGRQKPFIVLGCALSALAAASLLVWYTPAGFLFSRAVSGVASATWVCFTVLYGGYFSREEAPRRISQINIGNKIGQLAGFFAAAALVRRLGVRAMFAVALLGALVPMGLALTLREAPSEGGGAMRLRDLPLVAKDRHLLVCSLLSFLFYLMQCATGGSFTATLATAMGARAAQLSALNVAMSLPILLCNLAVVRWLLPRFGPKKLVVTGFALAVVYCALAPLCARLWLLYVLQVVMGVSCALVTAVLLGQCIRDVPPARRSAAMGFFQAVYGAGMTLGPVLSGVFIDTVGIRADYFFMAGVALVSGVLAVRFLRDQPA